MNGWWIIGGLVVGGYLIAGLKNLYEWIVDKEKEHTRERAIENVMEQYDISEETLNTYKKALHLLNYSIQKLIPKATDDASIGNKNTIRTTLCPEDGGYLRQRKGQYGDFLGCSNYPACRFTMSINEAKKASKEISHREFMADLERAYK